MLAKSLFLLRLAAIVPGFFLGGCFLIHNPSWASEVSSFESKLVAQAQPQQLTVLGVVRSSENAAQWQEITDRLEATGVTYRVIEWDEIQRTSDFGDITVLFLPNIETISSDQLLSLQAWMNRGGRIIASGAIGSQSSSGVKNALRSLLGAYWAADLSQAQLLQPLQLASQPWVREAESTSAVVGGVLVPTSLASQPVAVWNETVRSNANSYGAAVVVTQKATFLGWRWGDSSASLADLDSSWLRAAVGRFAGSSPLPVPTSASNSPTPSRSSRATATSSNSARESSPRQAEQTRPTRQARQAEQTRQAERARQAAQVRQVEQTRQAEARQAEQTSQTPLASQSNTASDLSSVPGSSNRQEELLRRINRTSSAAPPDTGTSQDPAEQVAPPELNLERSPRITLYEATTMRQELENLIGRYESALILANARANTRVSARTGLKTEQSNNSATGGEITVSSTQSVQSIDDAVLTQARQGYAAFSEALNQRDHATARQQWLATRQLLWNNFPLEHSLAQAEVRAMWLDRGTIVRAGSRQGLEQIFDRMADAGINTVFFETVNAGYPIYPSQVAPEQNPLTRHWDPLAEAVDLAHRRGMELHAWVWTFAAGNQVHNALLNQSASYPGPVLAAHPDWANYDNRGSLIPPGQTKPFLDPANSQVRSYLLNLFQEIVTRYDVDGLQLDYIRYPFQDPRAGGHTYGYGMAARQQFHQLTGVDPLTLSPTSSGAQQQLWQQWNAFRLEQINSFVADASRLVHRLKPELVLSTAVFALPERRRVNEIQQNWELWAQRGDVDMIVLMSYASDTNGLQRLAEPWLADDADLGSALVLPGIRLLNLTDESIVDQIQALRDSSSGGFALFAAENLNRRLQTIFHQTQGEASRSAEPIPYRQPFAAASSRYEVLLQQWNWLLDNGQMQLREAQLETWHSKTATLAQALQTLEEEPSSRNLQQAKTLLRSFQTQFKAWMNLPTLSEDYRVRTWQNQLATIERLLSYGERVVLARQETNRRQATSPQAEK